MKRHAAAGLVFIAVQAAVAPSSAVPFGKGEAPPKAVPVVPVVPATPAPSPVPQPNPPEESVPKVVPVLPVVRESPAGKGAAPAPASPTAPAPAQSASPGLAPLPPATDALPAESSLLRGEPAVRQENRSSSGPMVRPLPSSAAPAPNAEQAQLGLADALYSRQQWDGAVAEYQRFVSDFPRSPQLAPALYRLAECYMKMGSQNSAKLYFGKVLGIPQAGPFGGAAAFRLGESEFQERDFANAVAHFKIAAQQLPDPKAKVSAQYFTGRCLQELGRKLEARAVFQALADAPESHPFQENSQLRLARLLVEGGHASEARPRFLKLLEETTSEEIKAECVTQDALIQLEMNPKTATPALEKALQTKGTDTWHGLLRIGILKSAFALGESEKVIAAYSGAEAALDPAQLPEIQLLVGNAHKQLKQYTEAAAMYSRLIDAAPDSPSAATARYERLTCFYNLERKDLPQQIDAFLATKPKPEDRDNAMLMKAEFLRLREDYAAAGNAYSQLSRSKEFKPERRADVLMRWAECAGFSGDNQGALAATNELLTAFPNYKMASTALFWRAEIRNSAKQYGPAAKDYEDLLKKYPSYPDREKVIKRMALLKSAQNDSAGMAAYFEQLIKEYPESPSKAEANHWIGCAAYEAKDYKKAISYLNEARTLDPTNYFESDSLRLVYSAYNLNDPDQLWTRVQEYLPKGKNRIAADLLRWCARSYLDAKQNAKAEPVLTLLCGGEEVTENDWLQLATVRLPLNNFDGAVKAVQAYLPLVNHPAAKARGLLLRARAELGLGNHTAAQATVDETIRLQPDGLLNGEARLVAGDIQVAQKNHEAAAKLYESVSIAFDDDQICPSAMEKAFLAYRAASKSKEALSILNKLQSRYPEYAREHNLK